MKAKHETLESYLDALDAIKEKVADETRGMTAKEVQDYFARARRELEAATGQKLRLRRQRGKSQFMDMIERSRASVRAEGGISSEEMRRRFG